jgi:hypothetical protein
MNYYPDSRGRSARYIGMVVALISIIFFAPRAFAQPILLVPGVGIPKMNIVLGISTVDDIIRLLGHDFRRDTVGVSVFLRYKNIGIDLEYDPLNQIQSIGYICMLRSPAKRGEAFISAPERSAKQSGFIT